MQTTGSAVIGRPCTSDVPAGAQRAIGLAKTCMAARSPSVRMPHLLRWGRNGQQPGPEPEILAQRHCSAARLLTGKCSAGRAAAHLGVRHTVPLRARSGPRICSLWALGLPHGDWVPTGSGDLPAATLLRHEPGVVVVEYSTTAHPCGLQVRSQGYV
jgi:hypothetical protein